MKEECLIQETKEANGGKAFTQKDLLFYIVGRVDKLDDKLDEAIKLLNERMDKKLDKRTFNTVVLTGITIALAVIGGAFKLISTLLKGG